MKVNSFEDILAWQKAMTLTREIYAQSSHIKDVYFNSQLQRASVSVMNNIAEGFERKSNKELKQFLFIAKGSCGEVRSMIRLGEELGYIDETAGRDLIEKASEVSKMLSGFIKTL